MRRRRESAYGDTDRARDPDAEQDRDDPCPPKQMEDSGEGIRSVGRIISPMAGLVPIRHTRKTSMTRGQNRHSGHNYVRFREETADNFAACRCRARESYT
jgi:hypothetical protein